jgi:hypothetical protein
MKTTNSRTLAVFLEVDPLGMDVWRIVRSDSSEDPVFLNSLRSSYEMERPPRGVELSASVIHRGISVFYEVGRARATAQRWPKLGDYIARIQLHPGNGFNYAVTGQPGHLTLWGDPVKLSEATVDIDYVER